MRHGGLVSEAYCEIAAYTFVNTRSIVSAEGISLCGLNLLPDLALSGALEEIARSN